MTKPCACTILPWRSQSQRFFKLPQHSVKSAVRVFEILEYFAHCRRPARLTDIAKHLHYPVSSVNALLKSLVVQGYMKFDARTHLYIPAARLGHVTSWINFDGFEQAVMLDAMRRLRDAANGPVALASPIDIYLEYVDTLAGTNETDLRIKPGTRRILIQTGTGWLFLSRKSRAYARSIYRQTIDRKELTRLQFPEAEFLKKLDAHAGTRYFFLPRQRPRSAGSTLGRRDDFNDYASTARPSGIGAVRRRQSRATGTRARINKQRTAAHRRGRQRDHHPVARLELRQNRLSSWHPCQTASQFGQLSEKGQRVPSDVPFTTTLRRLFR